MTAKLVTFLMLIVKETKFHKLLSGLWKQQPQKFDSLILKIEKFKIIPVTLRSTQMTSV